MPVEHLFGASSLPVPDGRLNHVGGGVAGGRLGYQVPNHDRGGPMRTLLIILIVLAIIALVMFILGRRRI
jgi:hypothetical protein